MDLALSMELTGMKSRSKISTNSEHLTNSSQESSKMGLDISTMNLMIDHFVVHVMEKCSLTERLTVLKAPSIALRVTTTDLMSSFSVLRVTPITGLKEKTLFRVS